MSVEFRWICLTGCRYLIPVKQADTCGLNSINLSRYTYHDTSKINLNMVVQPVRPNEASFKPLLDSSNPTWAKRIEAVKTVIDSQTIFSLSYVPATPEESQILYFKKGLKQYENHTPKYEYYFSLTPVGGLKDDLSGFVKPFDTYSNEEFKSTVDPSHLEGYQVTDASENPEFTDVSVQKVVQLFREDSGASALAMTILNPSAHRYEKYYIHKIAIV